MKKKYFNSVSEYHKATDDFSWIIKPDCDYCGSKREENVYHPGTCAHCGAELRGFARVFLDPITGYQFEPVFGG